jgi:hypothetical protein
MLPRVGSLLCPESGRCRAAREGHVTCGFTCAAQGFEPRLIQVDRSLDVRTLSCWKVW